MDNKANNKRKRTNGRDSAPASRMPIIKPDFFKACRTTPPTKIQTTTKGNQYSVGGKTTQKATTAAIASTGLYPTAATATTRESPIDHHWSEMSATHTSLTAAAQQMNTLLETRFRQKIIYTALEVLFFAKGAKSLHFGEYPAKVHWPQNTITPAIRKMALRAHHLISKEI
jgi:hypothetical protein